MGNMQQPFQCGPVFTAAETQAKPKDIAGTSA